MNMDMKYTKNDNNNNNNNNYKNIPIIELLLKFIPIPNTAADIKLKRMKYDNNYNYTSKFRNR